MLRPVISWFFRGIGHPGMFRQSRILDSGRGLDVVESCGTLRVNSWDFSEITRMPRTIRADLLRGGHK